MTSNSLFTRIFSFSDASRWLALAMLLVFGATSLQALPTANLPWTTNYANAVTQAKKENKKILLNITGSDWCPWCVKLDEDVFNTPEFGRYARSHYVLVTVDFPRKTKLPDALAKQNYLLKEKYAPDAGFPAIVLLGADEKPLNLLNGYLPGGPTRYLAALDKDFAAGK